ncbi:LacI family DNA-binding transcriptional regulator [Bacillus sp. FSL W7-1360]
MKVTIREVAKQAGVAPSTVSRVIANSSRISSKTKARVRETMEALGYHPNFNARNLVNNRTNMLGVIIPGASEVAFQNPFFPEVLRGITTKAYTAGYGLALSTGQTDEDIFNEVKQMVQSCRVDGIILLSSKIDDQIIPYLLEQQFPFVLVGRPDNIATKNITYVNNDNVKAAKLVTEYLLLLGHEAIGFIGGQQEAIVTVDHATGYEQALHNAAIPMNRDYSVYYQEVLEGGQQAVIELMSLEKPPTALIVADDLMALGVLRMLDEMQVSVPEDISVISFNNVMLSELSSPPLTTVDIHIYELGQKATDALVEKIQTPDTVAKRIIVPHRLIKRQSCKKLDHLAPSK